MPISTRKHPLLALTGRLAICYVLLAVVFLCLSIGVNFIPREAIADNAVAIEQALQAEGMHANHFGVRFLEPDNYTDALMVGEAVAVEPSAPVRSAMVNTYYVDQTVERGHAVGAIKYAQGDTTNLDGRHYGRYWHGYQVLLRPMLTVVPSLMALHVVNYAIAIVCLALALWALVACGQRVCALWLVMSLLCVAFPLVPMSMQYMGVFSLALLGTAYVAIRQPADALQAALPFFVLGALTAYIDLLSTPIITLLIPATAWLCVVPQRRSMRALVTVAVCWGVAYAAIWALKWVLVECITGERQIADALQTIAYRSSGQDTDKLAVQLDKIGLTVPQFAGIFFSLVAIALGLIIAYGVRVRGRIPRFYNRYGALLAIAVVPVVWPVLLRNHSLVHAWFVWRIYAATIFALGVFTVKYRAARRGAY